MLISRNTILLWLIIHYSSLVSMSLQPRRLLKVSLPGLEIGGNIYEMGQESNSFQKEKASKSIPYIINTNQFKN